MRLARLPVLVAMLALFLLLVSGPGTRLELWHFRTGFMLMRWATFLGLGAAAVAVLLLLVSRTRRGHAMTLIFGTVLGLAAAAPPLLAAIRSIRPDAEHGVLIHALALGGDIHEDDITQLALREVGDTHHRLITFDADPFVVFGVLEVGRNVHGRGWMRFVCGLTRGRRAKVGGGTARTTGPPTTG